MTPKEQLEEIRLGENIHRLMEIVRQQDNLIEDLKSQLDKTLQAFKVEQAERAQACKQMNALLNAKNIATSPEEVDQTSKKVEALISDIDKCISLLESE